MSDANARDAGSPPLIDIRALLATLWRGRLLLALCIAGFLALGTVYILITKPLYTATAVLLVDPREQNTTESNNVLAGIGGDSAAIASQVSVIGSRELLLDVFDSEQIVSDPEFQDPGLLGGIFGRQFSREMILERFTDNITVDREGLTYVINVSFRSHEPDKSARIVNAIVDRYISEQIAEKANANAEVSELLESRIAELELEVVKAERAVEAFKVAHGIFSSASGPTLLQEQIEQLSVQLLAAQESARQAETRYLQALAVGQSPLGLISLTEMLSSPNAERLRDDYNQRATELASARSRFGSRHPTLTRLVAELAELEKLMVREVERITTEMRAASDVSASVVAGVEKDLEELRGTANVDNRTAVELRQLERTADASRQVLETFLKRSEETSQFQTMQFSDARVITKASAPVRPIWPKPTLILSVATLLGLVVGGCAALLFTSSHVPAVPRREQELPPRSAPPVHRRRQASTSRSYADLR